MRLRTSIVIASVFFIAGCSGHQPVKLSPEEAAVANFGPYPSNYQERAKAWFETALKDPYSAHFKFDDVPRKARVFKGLINGAGHAYGWTSVVGVNAKNGFGGYTGMQYYRLLFQADGQTFGAPVGAFGFFDYVAE